MADDISMTHHDFDGMLIPRSSEESEVSVPDVCFNELSAKEKNILAEICILQAESALKESASYEVFTKILPSLERAVELTPLSHEIWYRTGELLARFLLDEALSLAALSFEMATTLDATHFQSYVAWAQVLFKQGILTKNASLFVEAERKYALADRVWLPPKDAIPSDYIFHFYWKWGFTLFLLYREHEEPYELKQCISCYKKAFETGVVDQDFYNDYGNAIVEFSSLLSRFDCLSEAIHLYERSVRILEEEVSAPQGDLAIRYFNLACCYHFIFSNSYQEEYYMHAKACYDKVLKIDSSFQRAYIKRASLVLCAAKLWKDSFLFDKSVVLCKAALDQLCVDQDASAAQLLCVSNNYAEALIYCGGLHSNLNMIHEAEQIIEENKQKFPDEESLIVLEGMVASELAKYFHDVGYCNQAIDLFSQVCVESADNGWFLYHLAEAKVILGTMELNEHVLTEATALYFLASKSDMQRYGYFWDSWGRALVTLAEETQNQKVLEEAAAKFAQALIVQESIHPDWLFHYGVVLDMLGDVTDEESYYERAIQVLHVGLSLDPTAIEMHLQLGLCYMHFGEITQEDECFLKAIEQFESVLAEDPEEDVAHHEIAIACLYALENTRDEVAYEEDSLLLQKIMYHLQQAGRFGNTQVFYTLACFYALQGKNDEALLYLDRAYQEEEHPDVEDIMADAWLDSLRNTEAFQILLQKIWSDTRYTQTT